MSDISRRDVLRRLALTLTATGVLDRVAAEEVHQMAAQAAGRRAYTPKTFSRRAVQDARAADRFHHSVEHGARGALGPVENGAPAPSPPVRRRGST